MENTIYWQRTQGQQQIRLIESSDKTWWWHMSGWRLNLYITYFSNTFAIPWAHQCFRFQARRPLRLDIRPGNICIRQSHLTWEFRGIVRNTLIYLVFFYFTKNVTKAIKSYWKQPLILLGSKVHKRELQNRSINFWICLDTPLLQEFKSFLFCYLDGVNM